MPELSLLCLCLGVPDPMLLASHLALLRCVALLLAEHMLPKHISDGPDCTNCSLLDDGEARALNTMVLVALAAGMAAIVV
jgi:hypothetical protein